MNTAARINELVVSSTRRKLIDAGTDRIRIVALAILLSPSVSNATATFSIDVLDGENEGYNSNAAPDPVSTAAGNPGSTLGQQRVHALQNALDWWGQRLDSGVEIVVEAEMDALSCDESSAVLAAAGPNVAHMNFIGAPRPNTWYHGALANALSGSDLAGTDYADIGTLANGDIDNNDGCLQNINWFYGLGPAPAGTISFFKTMLHETGHGLGVSSFVSADDGSLLLGFPGIYEVFLEDHDTAPHNWPDLSDSQRLASMTDTGNLHWIGEAALSEMEALDDGIVGGHVRMFDPDPLQRGSSVSHWDTSLQSTIVNSSGNQYDDLMEPFATGNELVLLTDEMLEDEGWNSFEGDCGSPTTTANDTVEINNATVISDQEACISITTSGTTTISTGYDVTLSAGRAVSFGSGFSVQDGATFKVEIDPYRTLRQ